MIKIIKQGKVDFRKTCDKCGCIFEYNLEDIDDSYIKCPTCYKKHYGFDDDYNINSEPNLVPNLPKLNGSFQTNPCEGCPTYKLICSPGGYVGDLPCQWCKNNPYKFTCSYDNYNYCSSTFTTINNDMTEFCDLDKDTINYPETKFYFIDDSLLEPRYTSCAEECANDESEYYNSLVFYADYIPEDK
jgi:hypothetical protein